MCDEVRLRVPKVLCQNWGFFSKLEAFAFDETLLILLGHTFRSDFTLCITSVINSFYKKA